MQRKKNRQVVSWCKEKNSGNASDDAKRIRDNASDDAKSKRNQASDDTKRIKVASRQTM